MPFAVLGAIYTHTLTVEILWYKHFDIMPFHLMLFCELCPTTWTPLLKLIVISLTIFLFLGILVTSNVCQIVNVLIRNDARPYAYSLSPSETPGRLYHSLCLFRGSFPFRGP